MENNNTFDNTNEINNAKKKINTKIIFFIITILVFLIFFMADQVTKYLAELKLTTEESVTIIPNVVSVTLTYNTGMAWSMLNGDGGMIILSIVSAVASGVLMYFCLNNDWRHLPLRAFSLTLALAGCVGNLYDRLATIFHLRAGVVDMISWTWFDALTRNPSVFNLADFFLVTAIILFAIDYLIIESIMNYRRKKKKHAK